MELLGRIKDEPLGILRQRYKAQKELIKLNDMIIKELEKRKGGKLW